MADAICCWSNRGVEVSGIDDVRFRDPVTGVRELWTGLYEPDDKEGQRSANVIPTE